jgi:hypothetical protein
VILTCFDFGFCSDDNNRMKVEIDQSGKLEQLNTDTVVACANKSIGNAVWISAGYKQKIMHRFRKSLIPVNDVAAIWFAITIYLLIEGMSKDLILIVDEEYTGKENVILETLKKLLEMKFRGKWVGDIWFRRIGKVSPAHILALKLHRLKRKIGVKKLTEADFLRFF